jgi:LemA protein
MTSGFTGYGEARILLPLRATVLPRARAVTPMFLLIAVIILLATILYFVSMYNGLIQLRIRSHAAWADIDVQLKRRHDLIPNLVEAVKGYAAHERTTFERVTEARMRALTASGPAARAQAEGALSKALRGLFAVAENYPQLRATENFAQLQTQISEVEDQIQLARRYYNAVVRDLNIRIAQFPTNLVAAQFHFQPREFFETEGAERESPQVEFGTSRA